MVFFGRTAAIGITQSSSTDPNHGLDYSPEILYLVICRTCRIYGSSGWASWRCSVFTTCLRCTRTLPIHDRARPTHLRSRRHFRGTAATRLRPAQQWRLPSTLRRLLALVRPPSPLQPAAPFQLRGTTRRRGLSAPGAHWEAAPGAAPTGATTTARPLPPHFLATSTPLRVRG